MFSRIKGFLNRHKRKFIVGGVVLGATIFLTRYTQRKLREWQEKEVRELLERSKRKQFFEDTERACNQLLLTLSKQLRESIVKTLDTEAIVKQLRTGRIDKISSWNKLKVIAITRSAAVIYSHVMLVLLIRIQFNIVGGYMFKDSQNCNEIKTIEAVQQKYMSLCSYFMENGVKELCSLIQEKVKEITASMSLKDELTLRDLEQIYWSIMSSLSIDNFRDPIKNIARYVLLVDPNQIMVNENTTLSKMINGTLDVLENEEVQNITQSIISSGFTLLIDHIAEFFKGIPIGNNGTRKTNGFSIPGTSEQSDAWSKTEAQYNRFLTNDLPDVMKATMPVAKIIPIINGQVPDSPTMGDVPTEWMQSLILNKELKTLGANVYETFSF
ncbi:peroxisomal biogenesis factor 3 [Prorops nasuta]|uniref:peroxisomal biogenesis factor 3 n=1 Tax=Prorops nasuta TaxID=863751 RepID=UPI0034CF93C0